MGLTYKTANRSKPAAMGTSSTSKKKTGNSLENSYASRSAKHKKIKPFAVFERSKKKKKRDNRLFPGGIANKYKLHEENINQKKADEIMQESSGKN